MFNARDMNELSERARAVLPPNMKLYRHMPYVLEVDDETIRTRENGLMMAMEVTGIDGTVVIIARHTQHPDFNPVGHPFLGKRLRIVTTYAYPDDNDRWSRDRSFALTVDLLAQRRLNIAPMLTHEFAWHELPDVYSRLDEGDKSIVGTTIRWD